MDNARARVIDELLVLRCQEGNREAFDLLADGREHGRLAGTLDDRRRATTAR